MNNAIRILKELIYLLIGMLILYVFMYNTPLITAYMTDTITDAGFLKDTYRIYCNKKIIYEANKEERAKHIGVMDGYREENNKKIYTFTIVRTDGKRIVGCEIEK